MCGIVGFIGGGESSEALERTRASVASLSHRGPDDTGFLVLSTSHEQAYLLDREDRRIPLAVEGRIWASRGHSPPPTTVILGHRRLAIIDPSSAGHQPMCTRDGRFSIILNGEIYNYLELRDELVRLGHTFRSKSDTEVLLNAYVEWGPSCLDKLVGMFAFIVLDAVAGTLFVARDAFGMKPLYYTRTGAGLAFASEIAALRHFVDDFGEADPERLYEYLDRGISDFGAATMFARIHAVPAAHWAEVVFEHPDRLTVSRYWAPDLDRSIDISFDDAAAHLRQLFIRSVELHLRSDVRVGTMLSGGLDSSAIVMTMRELGGTNLDIHTFSYIAGQGAVSEEPWIDIVNAAAGAVSHKVELRPEEWVADLPQLIESQGEPFGNIAIYAQHRLFRLAAETGIRVVLDGQGADELMGGYRYLWSVRIAGHLGRGELVRALGFLRESRTARQSWDPSTLRTTALAGAMCLPPALTTLAVRALRREHQPWIDRNWCRRHGLPGRNPWWVGHGRLGTSHTLWHSASERSLPTLLRYEDRNSMAHSVEGRLPFLTPELTQFVLSLPPEYLIDRRGTGKAIFRAATRGLVPDAILDRRDKIGFSVPIHTWIPLIPELSTLLEEAKRIPAVNPDTVDHLLRVVRSGQNLERFLYRIPRSTRLRNTFLIWRLVGLAAWARHFRVSFP